MDTKWKNRLLVVSWFLLLTFGLNGVVTLVSHGPYYMKNYFNTAEFDHHFEDFITKLSIYELNQLPKEQVKALITVTNDEIEEYRYRYGDLSTQLASIHDQYESRITEALDNDNQTVADALIEERERKIEDISSNFSNDDYVREKVIKEKEQIIDDYYRQLENNRSEFDNLSSSFHYYLTDIQSGEVFTNIELVPDEMNSFFNANDMHYIEHYPSSNNRYLSTTHYGIADVYYDIDMSVIELPNREFEGKIAVPQSLQSNSIIQSHFESYQNWRIYYLTLGALGFSALFAAYFMYRRRNPIHSIDLSRLKSYHDRLPIDIQLLLFGFFAIVAASSITQTIFSPYDLMNQFYSFLSRGIKYLLLNTFFVAGTLVQAVLLKDFMKDPFKRKEKWEKALLYRGWLTLQDAFANRHLATKVILLLAITFGFGLAFSLVFMESFLIIPYGIGFVIIGLPVLFLLFKQIGFFNRIVKHTEALANGRLESNLPEKGKSMLAKHARHINTLKSGVKTSQREQAKSERLKTELISNVSHDLRTPLTSIITYVELLKSADLNKDDREAYTEIIDRKSKRLKVLIDDLFEASKMASGNIELEKKQVDLVQLLQQALAEYNEAMNESSLQFRISTPDTPIYANVDGQKIWRMFDNVIGNIFNYSLEHTRVYISIEQKKETAVIIFKNVTKYELGGSVDELFERFKRGDTSRHTEGSGLGLAIAKSIVDLHGGQLDIEVDGDLFKVIVVL
ncbi:histidine kinase dimerization/phospho-acceptor domain-containing protein [Halalkalibacter sp. AB-rgal2]|uniref:sensor histidine kinase n=1 Tax=Halalkalibacter sp. AB-rgal2 TaxID=3242695 RepID=UPI00359F125C